METCHYDTNHWPCNYCSASSPDSEDACCKYPEKEEKLYCPLCGQQVNIESSEDNDESFSFLIRCNNAKCLYPFALEDSKEKVIAKWKKYAR